MPPLLIDAGRIWLSNLTVNLLSYMVFTVTAWFILWVILRRPLRNRKIREATPPARQLLVEFFCSMRSMAIAATMGVGVVLAIKAGLYPLAALAESWGPWWFAASLVLMILGQDTYIYWAHRWMHHPRRFRAFHRRHHLSHNPSPFTAYSFDLREAVVMGLFGMIWPLFVPTPWGAQFLFLIHQLLRNTLLHGGHELMPVRADGRPWLDWLTTTTHHDLHHAEAGYNYGPWFTWWDRWMGTEHPEYLARYAQAVRRPLAAPAIHAAMET